MVLHSKFYILNSRKGQSIIEILVAIAVGVIMVGAAASVIVPSLRVNTQAERAQVGTGLAKELLDNVRVWGEGDWHNISNLATGTTNHYYLNTSSSPFSAITGDQSITVSTTTYKRFFYVSDVFRDGTGVIQSSGSYDPSTKKITVGFSWPQSTTSTIGDYLTRSGNKVFDQTDWSGGPGQGGPVTTTNSLFSTSSNINYSTTTGSIQINL